MVDKRFYVYGHYTKDTDTLFYIGKGSGNRAWTYADRGHRWTDIVTKHGLVVKLIKTDLDEQTALYEEQVLITTIGLENLTNYGMLSGATSAMMKSVVTHPEWRRQHKKGQQKFFKTTRGKRHLRQFKNQQPYGVKLAAAARVRYKEEWLYEIIPDIMAVYSPNKTLKEIRTTLNKQGILTRKGNPFTTDTQIRRILLWIKINLPNSLL